jgi:hypothetical protein
MDTKKQIYIIISVFLLLLLLLILFFIWPLFREVKKSSESLSLQIKDAITLERQLQEAEKFQQKYESYQPGFQKIESMFVDSSNPVTFIEFLENIAQNKNIKLQISAPLFSIEKGLTFANLQLFASGSFSGIIKFIKEIELGPYLIQTQNLSLESRKTGIGTITADISIKALAK